MRKREKGKNTMGTTGRFLETLPARLMPAAVARRRVDELIQREHAALAEYRRVKRERHAFPPAPAGDIFVWFDQAGYGNGGKGFYYVRFHSGRSWHCTAYDRPALIVKKSKLRTDQVAFMERKCRETEEEARKIPEQQEFNFHQNWSRNNAAGK